MKDVEIKIYDKQVYETHSDSNEQVFKGQLAYKNNYLYLSYKDTEGVTSIIKVKEESVSVKRLGAIKGDLKFDTKKPHRTDYQTPYGRMDMEIVTQNCNVYILEKGVKIYIEYKILMDGQLVSNNIYMLVAN